MEPSLDLHLLESLLAWNEGFLIAYSMHNLPSFILDVFPALFVDVCHESLIKMNVALS